LCCVVNRCVVWNAANGQPRRKPSGLLALPFSSWTWPYEYGVLPKIAREVREFWRRHLANLGLGHRAEMLKSARPRLGPRGWRAVKARVITLDDGTEQVIPEQRKPVSAGEINRELQILKRIFSLAIESGRIAGKPAFKMLREAPARAGFFEPEQYASVLAHLPAELRPVVTFAYITGWRLAAEVLPLEWRQVDFDAGEVRLDAGTTKNGEGRVFPLTAKLRTVLAAQHAEHERLKKAGQIEPWVFFRMVAKGRGGEKKPKAITSLNKAWKAACRAAGCPGRIPHDLRRTAVRNLVRAGISERVAMMMTGHKTPSVFQRYNIVSDGDLREAALKLDVAGLSQPVRRGRVR
jgi:integrase